MVGALGTCALAFALTLGAAAAAGQDVQGLSALSSVMIDPGHGGTDAGCIGVSGIAEKELTLKIAHRLDRALAAEFPDLVTEMTRVDDSYPTLEGRTHLANLLEADVLLSLHFNCAENHLAEGIETFFLHPEGTVPGDEVPGLEHQGAALHCVEYGVGGEGAALIVSDLFRLGAMLDSARLAESLQRELVEATRMTNRGVRFARFRVLRGAHMPAVVAELGFLTNEDEAQRLVTNEVLDQLVSGLVEGLRRYDEWLAERDATVVIAD